MIDFSRCQFFTLISATSQLPIPIIEVIEDVEMITEGSTSIGFDYREFTSFFNMDKTIIRETELDVLILGDDLFGIYNKSGLSSEKRKRDIDICRCDFSVSVT